MTTPTLGIIQEPLESYFKNPALSPHDIRRLRQSPAHYEYYKKNPNNEEKNQLNLNAAIHCYLRNKDEFYQKYIGAKINQWAKKEEKAKLFEDHQTLFEDKIVIDKHQFSLIEEACENLRKDKDIMSLFVSGQEGMSAYSQDEKTGIIKKARLAWIPTLSNNFLYDYSIYETPYRIFYNTIFYEGHHNYIAHTLQCFNKSSFMLISIEGYKPYQYRPQILEDTIIEKANIENRLLTDVYYYCKKNKMWFTPMQFDQVKEWYIHNNLYEADKDGLIEYINKYVNKEDGSEKGDKYNGRNKKYEYMMAPKWL